jgi:uncharacterized protein (PEP-CTERM system associated)
MASTEVPAKTKGLRGHRALLCPLLSASLAFGAALQARAQTASDVYTPPASETRLKSPAPGAAGTESADDGITGAPLGATGFQLTKRVDLSEIYTSNGLGVSGGSGGRGGSDWVTRLLLNVGVHDHTARLDADVDYTLGGFLYVRNSSLAQITNRGAAIVRADLVPEHLQLQARAFAGTIYVNQLGALSATDRPVADGRNSGQRNTYGYTVAPNFTFRLGDFLTSSTMVSDRAVYFDRPNGPSNSSTIPGESDPENTNSYGLTQTFSSGIDFNRLNWRVLGMASKTTRGAGDISELSGIGDFKYAVSRTFALLATGGYQSITTDQKLNHDLRGVFAMGGVQVTLGPRLQGSIRAGRQFNFNSYIGNVSYQISGATVLVGSATDTVTTPAMRLLNNLGSLGTDPSGNLVDTNYQQPDIPASGISGFDAAPMDQLGFSNNISRYRMYNLSLLHDTERTHYRVTAFTTVRDILTSLTPGLRPRQHSTGGNLNILRSITPRIDGNFDTTYVTQDFEGTEFGIFRASIGANYRMTPDMQFYSRIAYLHRSSDQALASLSPSSGDLSDVNVLIGVRKEF